MDKLRAMLMFCRTVEAKSFAAAAQSLELVPSALSKAVAGLEQDLGFRLLNRSTRSLSLTEEGSTYYDQCRQVLQDIEEAEQLGRSSRANARGTLRVGLHPAMRYVVMTALHRLLDEQPDLRIETAITNSPSAIANDSLDVVLHIGRLADSSLVARTLGWTSTVVCASPGYLRRRPHPTHPNDLMQHRAVIYARRDEEPNTHWIFQKDGKTCEVEVKARLVTSGGIGLIDAVVGGCGVARPFNTSVDHLLRAGDLCALLQDWVGERQPISAVLPGRGRPSVKVALFLDFVTALLGSLDAPA